MGRIGHGHRTRVARRTTARPRGATVVAVLAIIAIIAVVFVAMAATRRFAEDRIGRDVRDRLEGSSALAAVAVAENVDRLVASAQSLASDPDLVAAIKAGNVERQDTIARRLQLSTSGARVGFVVTPAGVVTSMYPVDPAVIGKRFDDRDWYRGVLRSSPYLSEAYEIAAFDRPRAVSVATTVRDESRAVIGIVTVVVEVEEFGRALLRAARAEGSPSLVIEDQSGAPIAGDDSTFDDGLEVRRPIRGTGWSLRASLSEREAFADLRNVRAAATSFASIICALLLLLGAILLGTSMRLSAARRVAERRSQAFELNDTIVQRLAVAHMALALGRHEEARAPIEDALDAGRRIIGELAEGRESFVRDVAAHDAPVDARVEEHR